MFYLYWCKVFLNNSNLNTAVTFEKLQAFLV